MLHTKFVSIIVATFLMTLIWTLPTAYAGHCRGNHADDPLCPPPPPDVHDELATDHASLSQKLDDILSVVLVKTTISTYQN